MEIWLPIAGYEGHYEVSSVGRVRSIDRVCSDGARRSGLVLRPKMPNGRCRYLQVNLSKSGTSKCFLVHALVLSAFVGPRVKGMEACHNNGDALDNRAVNLRWDTGMANALDKIRHGTNKAPRGERSPCAKLCAVDIERIFDLDRGGALQREIADWFGVAPQHIGRILAKKRWQHLDN